MTTAELVEAVKAHALDHYEVEGWSVIVECFDDAEIVAQLVEDEATTVAEALASFADQVSIWGDRMADAINSAF